MTVPTLTTPEPVTPERGPLPDLEGKSPLSVTRELLRSPAAVVEVLQTYETLAYRALEIFELYSSLRLRKGSAPQHMGSLLESHAAEQLGLARALVSRMRVVGAVSRLQWQLDRLSSAPLAREIEGAVTTMARMRWSWRAVFQQAMSATREIKDESQLADHVRRLQQLQEAQLTASRTALLRIQALGGGREDSEVLDQLIRISEQHVWGLGLQVGLAHIW